MGRGHGQGGSGQDGDAGCPYPCDGCPARDKCCPFHNVSVVQKSREAAMPGGAVLNKAQNQFICRFEAKC